MTMKPIAGIQDNGTACIHGDINGLLRENDRLREEKRELVEALVWIFQCERGSRAFESALGSAKILLARVNAKDFLEGRSL